MSVRPIFWYALTIALLLALGLSSWENIATVQYEHQREMTAFEQEYILPTEKTDTAHFLSEITAQAEILSIEIALFTTAENNEQSSCPCQITAVGAYNDLAAWLAWLEKQPAIQEIVGFVLEDGQGEDMQLAVDLLLY